MGTGFLQKVLALPFSRRQERLAMERPRLSEDQFAKQVVDEGGDEEAAYIIRKKLCDWAYAGEFTPYPDDDLTRVYGIAEEELDEDLILAVLNELGVPPPNAEQLKEFGSVETPLRVARLVSFARSLRS